MFHFQGRNFKADDDISLADEKRTIRQAFGKFIPIKR